MNWRRLIRILDIHATSVCFALGATCASVWGMPKAAEHVRTQSNARVRAERKAEVLVPTPPPGAVSIITQSQIVTIDGKPYLMTVTLTPQEPPPVPVGIVFGNVTETLGAIVVAKPSGWGLILHGSGFPTTGTLRLQVAGRIAPSSSIVWRKDSVEFTVPPGPPGGTVPITGPFEVYSQENGIWKLLGRGGTFTILPG